ncbi:extradiol ring-cleavage dioxygenase [Streptomyces mirabilis]|uniref:DODA-type extradiol aromatic ring-opening family dioxygenase n=1 Tax=Streptomyces mirabilis TaxID=68239 RepID=UPI00224FC03C|nr:extradiol ring-cleavage dioxygenase [Streptomyces mirabilis]MCX4428907.1 extradiol ring-cleavage dioxygenase [Streptomyces mirabilis]
MAEVLGLGITHYPMLAGADTHMANLLKSTLKDPDIPAERKEVHNWTELAQREWGDDQGVGAAVTHRERLLADLARCREALDEFRPDVVVVWGDDQYENFREEVIPSFCVLAYDDTEVEAFAVLEKVKVPNAWGLPKDTSFRMRGLPDFAKRLASDVLVSGVDIAYSYEQRKGVHFPHAFANTQIFLDYEHAGREFPYPIVPIAVNCYGEHVIARRGGFARFAEINAGEQLDPPGPSPARCFELGRAVARVARASDQRVALVASSSWSHAFLNDKDWHLRPDSEADRKLYDALVAGDYDTWQKTTTRQIVDAGQHEMLNWFCLLGAMSELGLDLEWSDFVQTEILNSNKTFAVYR